MFGQNVFGFQQTKMYFFPLDITQPLQLKKNCSPKFFSDKNIIEFFFWTNYASCPSQNLFANFSFFGAQKKNYLKKKCKKKNIHYLPILVLVLLSAPVKRFSFSKYGIYFYGSPKESLPKKAPFF